MSGVFVVAGMFIMTGVFVVACVDSVSHADVASAMAHMRGRRSGRSVVMRQLRLQFRVLGVARLGWSVALVRPVMSGTAASSGVSRRVVWMRIAHRRTLSSGWSPTR